MKLKDELKVQVQKIQEIHEKDTLDFFHNLLNHLKTPIKIYQSTDKVKS